MAQLSSTNILGNLTVSNNATVNNTLTVNEGVYSGSLYLEEDASSPYYLRLYSDSDATANRTLTLNTNNADRTISLSGNLTVSSTATISGTNTGDQTSVSGNAGSASQAYITSTNTTGTYYVPFVGSSASGNQGLNVYTSLTFNPNTGVLTTTTFSGALSGNASTATKLATARNIFGISFDGSGAISHTATAGFAKFDASGNFTTTDTNTYSVSTHTHSYAGSGSAGGAANSVANALTFSTGITVNSGTTFDGSAARTISVAYGSTASTACVGNDLRLSDSRPASDVSAWAKAASKPTYTYSEVGAQASSTNLTSLAGLSYSSTAFVKMTGAGTFALDTNTYSVSTHTHAYTNIVIQDAAPATTGNSFWWESDTGKLKVNYNEAWVDATPVPDMNLYFPKAGGTISGATTINAATNLMGLVGVNTSNPTSYLAGTQGMAIYHATVPGLALQNDTRGYVWYVNSTAGSLQLYDRTAGAERARFTTDGYFGVGGHTPTCLLDVRTPAFANTARVAYISNSQTALAHVTYDTAVIYADDVTALRIAEADGTQLGLSAGDAHSTITTTHDFRFFTGATTTGSIYYGAGGTLRATISATGLTLANDLTVSGGYIYGPYGTMIQSTDEWLRINVDGTHSSGTYYGSTIVRTDGQFQVGSGGVNFYANSSGNVGLNGVLAVTTDTDADLTGGGSIVVGPTSSANLAIDGNEILARNNGAAGTLFLNSSDSTGPVAIGGGTPAEKLSVLGNIAFGSVENKCRMQYNATEVAIDFIIT